MKALNHRLCVAPMMSHTDRHFRFLLRLLSKHTLLYTEMVTTGALLYGDTDKHLRFNEEEHPLGIQLGGNDPQDLTACAKLAMQYGYDEVNLNIGCPSDRVKKGRFGACLMAEPELVAECVHAMSAAVAIPVTVKTRIGIDRRDSYEHLLHFIKTVSAAGCQSFMIHARKAWLQGLSPRQNREVPPLRYDVVYRLKQDLPHLQIIINGGINRLVDAQAHLQYVDGVMMGRAIYHNPCLLARADQSLFGGDDAVICRSEALSRYMQYMERQMARGESLYAMARHILPMCRGQHGARACRRYLSEHVGQKGAGLGVVEQALSYLRTA